MNGILRNWESLCDIRPDCHHHFDASGTSNAMFDELAERSLMSPLAGTKHTYVRLAIISRLTISFIGQQGNFPNTFDTIFVFHTVFDKVFENACNFFKCEMNVCAIRTGT